MPFSYESPLRRKVKIEHQAVRDHVILLHEYGYKNMLDGVFYHEAINHLRNNGIVANSDNAQWIIDRAFKEVFIPESDWRSTSKKVEFNPDEMFYMTSPAYYRYLEYLELVATNQNSKEAKRSSTIAICIASALALIQIWIELNKS